MIYAMLAAYRRTLRMTMEQARSMQQVVEQPALAWLETPDQGVVWGIALGLQQQVEDVIEPQRRGRAGRRDHLSPVAAALVRLGLVGGKRRAALAASRPGSSRRRPMPDFGGMMSALGSIGNSPSSSGGGGGFGGGGGGGGGGGAGGGF